MYEIENATSVSWRLSERRSRTICPPSILAA